MISVMLSYNPYLKRTRLCVDGRSWIKGLGRLGSFVVDQPMEIWAYPYIQSYRRWNGILPELMGELNEDMLALTFQGTAEDYAVLRETLQDQRERIHRLGYSDADWTLKFREAFQPLLLSSTLQHFLASFASQAPSQLSSSLFEMALGTLLEARHLTVAELCECYQTICSGLNDAVSYCEYYAPQKKGRWEKHQSELDIIMQGGAQ